MHHQFNIQQCHVLPTQCLYVFCTDLKQTAIISPHTINWPVFITETKCVYCAVRAECLNISVTEVNLSLAEVKRSQL